MLCEPIACSVIAGWVSSFSQPYSSLGELNSMIRHIKINDFFISHSLQYTFFLVKDFLKSNYHTSLSILNITEQVKRTAEMVRISNVTYIFTRNLNGHNFINTIHAPSNPKTANKPKILKNQLGACELIGSHSNFPE